MERVRRSLPLEGQVRLLMMTDMQFSRMQVYLGKTRINTEKPPDQLSLF
jgi:CRISPR-associated protein Cas2